MVLIIKPMGGTATEANHYPLRDEYPQVLTDLTTQATALKDQDLRLPLSCTQDLQNCEHPHLDHPGAQGLRNLTVYLKDDGIGDTNKTLKFRITGAWEINPVSHQIHRRIPIERAEATGTIVDGGPPPPSLSVADTEGFWGARGARFVVTLSPGAALSVTEVTVDYATEDGTASGGGRRLHLGLGHAHLQEGGDGEDDSVCWAAPRSGGLESH